MILVALGSNLDSPEFGSPQATLEAALAALESAGVHISKRSSFYRSAPVPPSGQPWFVNAVVAVETDLPPGELLETLHRIESRFGRVRKIRNESRTLDLDLLAFGDRVGAEPGGPILPHPRLQDRLFVLEPLAEIAPDWRHPVLRRSAQEMLAALGPGQSIERVE